MNSDKKDSGTVEVLLDTIGLAAEKMGERIIDSDRRKMPDDEKLKEIKELTEIKIVVLTLKKLLGLISEEECREKMKLIRGF